MDPIADLLTRIRNANIRQKDRVDVPLSKMKMEVVRVLKEEGFIANFKTLYNGTNKQGTIRVFLKYSATKEAVIRGIKRVSKPGLRVYAKSDELPRVLGGLGVAIISTSQGLLTDRQARKRSVGGEVLAFVW